MLKHTVDSCQCPWRSVAGSGWHSSTKATRDDKNSSLTKHPETPHAAHTVQHNNICGIWRWFTRLTYFASCSENDHLCSTFKSHNLKNMSPASSESQLQMSKPTTENQQKKKRNRNISFSVAAPWHFLTHSLLRTDGNDFGPEARQELWLHPRKTEVKLL